MRDLQLIADRIEIEALRGESTDALMMRDYDRFASLFTEDDSAYITAVLPVVNWISQGDQSLSDISPGP